MHRFLAACSLLFFLPFSVRAEGPTFISEVAWAGSSASLADEWLEICGVPGTDLSGWSIEGASADPITLPSGSAVPASGAFLIANYPDDDARSTLAVGPDFVTTSVSLSNSGLFITLRDADGMTIDVAGASDTAPFAGASGAAKASMERLDPSVEGGRAEAWASASASDGFDPGAAEFGTPGTCASPIMEPEAPPTSSATSGEETAAGPEAPAAPSSPTAEPMSPIRISEIYPSPNSGEEEWVELVNPSAVGEFLDGWTVEDARGTRTALEGLLMSWARVVIGSPRGSLNNDGDIVILRDRLGRAIDRVEYPKTARGEAFMRVELQDAFVMTLTPTPGAANVHAAKEAAEGGRDETAPETPTTVSADPPNPPPSSFRPERSEVKESIRPETDPSSSLGMAKKAVNDGAKMIVPKPVAKKTVARPKAAASRYKGDAYAATVVVPPGVYSKTRAYIQRDGTIEELRLSKSPAGAWNVGDRITFVAQTKTEGAVSFLLANPNSVRTAGSASATFTTVEAWPEEAGGYRFTAEVASIRGDAVEVSLGGVEGDVLAPAGTASALKPGDEVRVEGFIAPGPRPKVVLPGAHALRLFKTRLRDEPVAVRKPKLPASLAVGLTVVAAGVGIAAYLRMRRIKRLALAQAPIEEGAWE